MRVPLDIVVAPAVPVAAVLPCLLHSLEAAAALVCGVTAENWMSTLLCLFQHTDRLAAAAAVWGTTAEGCGW